MACGKPMGTFDARVAASPPPLSRPGRTMEVDGAWESSSTPSVVPDDELEIEEIVDNNAEGDASQAVNTLRQVRDYLIDLDLESKPTSQGLAVCRNLMRSLNGAGDALGKQATAGCRELSRALESFRDTAPEVSSKKLARVREKYDTVASLVPQLGDFDAERQHRARVILKAILEQVPGLGPLGRDKLERAGYADVEALCRANRSDLEQAGLAPELAERVFVRTARFKRRLNSVPPDASRFAERNRLRRLTATLKAQNQKFESLTNDWSPGSGQARRRVSDARAETMSQVSLLLARLGELDTQRRIERLPFERKADELERLLGALDDTHGQSPQVTEEEHG